MIRSRITPHLLLGAALSAVACAPTGEPQEDPLIRHPGEDVLAAGSEVALSDSVAGDVMVAGATVSFSGFAGGSYLGAGRAQRVDGRIDGSARLAGASIELSGSVGRNLTAGGGYVLVTREARIDRNAYMAGGRIEFEGSVGGDLYVVGEDVRLDGEVRGDVRVEAQRLTLGPAALIGGDLTYRVAEGSPPVDASRMTSGNVEALPPWELRRLSPVPYVYRVLAFVLAGLVVVALFPRAAGAAADAMERRPAASAGVGILWILLGPIAVAVLAATVIGLPLALVTVAVYAASLYLAPIVPAVWVGRELLSRAPAHGRRRPGLVRVLAGALIVAFAVLLPWVGWFARLAATVLGLGALVLALRTSDTARAA